MRRRCPLGLRDVEQALTARRPALVLPCPPGLSALRSLVVRVINAAQLGCCWSRTSSCPCGVCRFSL